MCGRFTLVSSADELAEFFKGFVFPTDLLPRYNIAPTQSVPVALNDGTAEAKDLRWGLVPYWAKDVKIGSRMINARSETLVDKPSFRESYRKRRCLVFADSFYEWKRLSEKEKQPMRVQMKSEAPFAMAGLWDTWKTPEGDRLSTFTVITTAPNGLMAPIHNRMPVILAEDSYDTWLRSDDDVPDAALQALLAPYPEEEMEAYPVSRAVNNVRNDGPECIQPAKADTGKPGEQPELF